MARERKDVLVRMPAELKRDLAREVEATEGNLNDLAVGILASRFAVPFEPSGRKGSAPSTTGDVLNGPARNPLPRIDVAVSGNRIVAAS